MNLIKIWIYSLIAAIIGFVITFFVHILGIIVFIPPLITSNLLIIYILETLLILIGPSIIIVVSYLMMKKNDNAQVAKSFLIRSILIFIILSSFFFGPYWLSHIKNLKFLIMPSIDIEKGVELGQIDKTDYQNQPTGDWGIIDQSETVNWYVYKSEKLGFEVKYPNGWAYEHKYPNSNQVGFYPIGTDRLSSSRDKEILPDIDFHEIGSQKASYDLGSLMEKQKYKIGDIKIIKFIPISDQSLLDTIIYLPDGKIYEVYVWSDAREIFGKMLTTLKPI